MLCLCKNYRITKFVKRQSIDKLIMKSVFVCQATTDMFRKFTTSSSLNEHLKMELAMFAYLRTYN